MSADRAELGRLITAYRRSAGLTQAAVAARLNRPQSIIAEIENGRRRLDVIELIELAQASGFRAATLVDQLVTELRSDVADSTLGSE